MNNKKTILVVDDSETNLVSAKEALESTYNVMTTTSGEKLLKMLSKITPNLILLDVEMPDMDGYDVLRALKADEELSKIPVVMLTAKRADENEAQGFDLGALDYITKPFSPKRLVKRLESHLALFDYVHRLDDMVKLKTQRLVETQNAIISVVAELAESRDQTTGEHIERVQMFLGILIDEMKKHGVYLEEVNKWDLYWMLPSAQLHDVGKIKIPDSILKKPGKLTDEEFLIMQTHTVEGVAIIEQISTKVGEDAFLEYAKLFAGYHHEKWNGSGYPLGLAGVEIPLPGRILAIVDVYDALVSVRPYKKAFSHEQAVEIIKQGKGSHFDPALVDVFLACEQRFKNRK